MKILHEIKTPIPEAIIRAAAAMLFGWSGRAEFKWDGAIMLRKRKGDYDWTQVIDPKEWVKAYGYGSDHYMDQAKERFRDV